MKILIFTLAQPLVYRLAPGLQICEAEEMKLSPYSEVLLEKLLIN
jgi:hypothetical protein